MVVVGVAFPFRADLQRAVDPLKIDVGRACQRLFLKVSNGDQALPFKGLFLFCQLWSRSGWLQDQSIQGPPQLK